MARTTREQKISRTSRYRRLAPVVHTENERGIALVIALVMLVFLGILGTWALDTTTTELKIAGNARTEQYAFFAADAGVGYVTNANTLAAVYNYGAGWVSPSNLPKVDVATSSTFTAGVPSLIQGALPQNGSKASMYDAAISGAGWHGIYSAVTSTGNAPKNAQVVVEAVVAQAVPGSLSYGGIYAF